MPTGLTDVDVVNAALQQIAAQKQITALNDGSPAAVAASVIYTPTVELMLRLMEPDFARVTATLVDTGISPGTPWTNEYIYPTDCIRLLQVKPAQGAYDVNDPQPLNANVMSQQITTGSVTFSALPAVNDTVTLNGAVFTWVASGGTSSNYQINITGSVGGMVLLWLHNLQNSATYLADVRLNVANYSDTITNTTAALDITYKTAGSAGIAYTLAKSSSVVTISGAALSVSGTPVILANVPNADAIYISSSVTEAEWNAAFTDAVVRQLANPLAMALSGRPDFADHLLQQAGKSAAMADAVEESNIRPR